jgi:LysM repeat protein
MCQLRVFQINIQPGETLTSASLKYNVPASELKRVNNLLTDNEFFALKRIKVPVKPSSLLTEMLPVAASHQVSTCFIVAQQVGAVRHDAV